MHDQPTDNGDMTMKQFWTMFAAMFLASVTAILVVLGAGWAYWESGADERQQEAMTEAYMDALGY